MVLRSDTPRSHRSGICDFQVGHFKWTDLLSLPLSPRLTFLCFFPPFSNVLPFSRPLEALEFLDSTSETSSYQEFSFFLQYAFEIWLFSLHSSPIALPQAPGHSYPNDRMFAEGLHLEFFLFWAMLQTSLASFEYHSDMWFSHIGTLCVITSWPP